MSFADLGLNPIVLKCLETTGYTEPTGVQSQAIPAALEGKDLLVSSHTGSGKTAAFLLPSLHKLAEPSQIPGAEKVQGPRLLVLCPTRELALQVQKQAGIYGAGIRKLRTVCLVGGAPFGPQFQAMRYNPEVMIATPGRLIDHMERGRIDFSRLEVLVLDEADRMLDMGFVEDIEHIVARTPATRQTMLFSATLDGMVGRIAAQMTKSPIRIEVATREEHKANIDQRLFFTDDVGHKHRLLDVLLRDVDLTQAVVFTATKKSAEELSETLLESGFAAAALHGDMPQHKRNRTLQRLRDGHTRILVATDVAARGIDVAGISHVINFDAPRQAEDYVHRIGRTGRAGRTGVAVTLVHGRERGLIRDIERYTGQTVRVDVIAGMEPTARHDRPFGKPGGKKFGHKPGGGKTWGDKKPWGEPKPWGDRKWEDKPRGAYQGQGTDRPRAEDSRGGGYAGNGGSWQGKPESRPAWKDGNTGGEARPARSNTWDRGEKNGNTWGKPEVRRADVNGNSVSYKPESRPANPHGRTWGEDARPHGGAKPRGRQSW
jgi:superfamily II DNA/RNA helicase